MHFIIQSMLCLEINIIIQSIFSFRCILLFNTNSVLEMHIIIQSTFCFENSYYYSETLFLGNSLYYPVILFLLKFKSLKIIFNATTSLGLSVSTLRRG